MSVPAVTVAGPFMTTTRSASTLATLIVTVAVEVGHAIAENREPIGGGVDGLEAVRATLAAYAAEQTKSVVHIPTFTAAN